MAGALGEVLAAAEAASKQRGAAVAVAAAGALEVGAPVAVAEGRMDGHAGLMVLLFETLCGCTCAA